jgi:glucokinase
VAGQVGRPDQAGPVAQAGEADLGEGTVAPTGELAGEGRAERFQQQVARGTHSPTDDHHRRVEHRGERGDAFCLDQLAGLGTWLGDGIASLAAILDPAVVVIGGGVSAAGDLLLDPIRTAFGGQLTGRGHRPLAEIRLAVLGNRAGLIGAADLARHR